MTIPSYPAPWNSLVRLITNGQAVDETETNKPLTDLIQRDQHLKDLLDLAFRGEALYLRSVAVDSAVAVGQPVYLNKNTGAFGQAIAEVDFDNTGVWGTVSQKTYVWGVVSYKHNATMADIVTFGVLRDTDMSASISDPSVSGPRYLSGATPGKLTQQRPAVNCYVLYWDAVNQIALVTPTPKENLEGHIHYRFQLVSQPAGVPNMPAYAEKHSIVSTDTSKQGWLPADDAIFGGMAPPGAKFGYNLAQHESLSSVFPPIPVGSSYLEVFGEGWGTGREPDEFIKIDNNGIWWMRDDWGWAPWSISYWDERFSSSSISSYSGSGGAPNDLPPPVDLQLTHGYAENHGLHYGLSIYLWFSRMTFKTDNAIVASLSACPGQPIRVLDCNCDQEASTGHLKLALDFSFQEDPTPVSGAKAFKEVDGLLFKSGYLVEKIKSLSPNIVVTGTTAVGDATSVQQSVTIDFINPNTNDRELDISLVGLDNAREEVLSDILFIGFPTAKDASIRAKIDVPSVGFPANTVTTNMALRFRIIGTAAGTMPPIYLSYRRLPSTDSATPYTLPTTDTALTPLDLSLVNGGSPISPNDIVEVETETFRVYAGDSVFFTFERTGTDSGTDTYAGTVGIIRQKGMITIP